MNIVQTMKRAVDQHRGGDRAGARATCAGALRRAPEHAGAHNLMGVFHKSEGDLGAAERHLRRAVELDGVTWHYHAALGNLLDEQARYDEAVGCFEHAVRFSPRDPRLRFSLATALQRLGRHQEALACWRVMAELAPDSAVAHFNLGNASYARGEYAQAVDSYTRVLAKRPRNLDALNNLASAQLALGRHAAAEATLRRGLAYADPGSPGVASLHANLGAVLALQGHVEAPTACYRRALSADPDYLPAAVKLGHHLLQQGDLDGARARFQGVLDKASGTAGAVAGLAEVLERGGQTSEAEALVRDNLALAATEPNLAAITAALLRGAGAAAEALPLVTGLLAGGLPDAQRSMLLHHLGHLRDALGERDEAFAAWTEANALRGLRFDADAWRDEVERVERRTPPAPVATIDERPVLIVGMPRSGTSLVEQILGCHPAVFAAGELENLRLMAERPGGDPEGLARFYRRHLDACAGDAARVTDKMPQNFRWLDLAGALLPGARVIHVRRRPEDVALSCLRQSFSASYDWSTSLEGIAAYYAGYERVMARWLAAPAGPGVLPTFEVDYERLVSAPEVVIPALVDFCGLDWDERCLRPHESARVVHTASYAQVRAPIHVGSVHRSAPYTEHLRPFTEALAALRRG